MYRIGHRDSFELATDGTPIFVFEGDAFPVLVLVGDCDFLVGYLRNDEVVDDVGIQPCIPVLEPEKHVGMGIAALLEFNGVDVRIQFSEGSSSKVFQQLLQFQVKHPRDNVWPVLVTLAFLQLRSDFLPIGIARHGHKKVRPAEMLTNGHGIHVFFMVPPVAPGECGRQDDGAPSRAELAVTFSY